jgi:uncharacterized membrane protein
MNEMRKALEAGGTVVHIHQVDAKTGKILSQRKSRRREAKRSLQAEGLSGRQIKKLLKQARREEKADRGE